MFGSNGGPYPIQHGARIFANAIVVLMKALAPLIAPR
jgi:hypothetical protein